MGAPDVIRVLCWDDPRATEPLRAAIEAYRAIAPETTFELSTRPLAAFNDEPIEQAAARTDLIVFDHPMVPRAAETGVLRPLDDLLNGSTGQHEDGIGGTTESYRWGDRTWGIAIDAACQVTAAREDLLAALGEGIPQTFAELLRLADEHPGRVVLPLYPSDAICTLMSLSVAHARSEGEPDTWLRPEAIDSLISLVDRTDPRGFGRNPPGILAAMQEHDDWILAPFVFGYANVARTGRGSAIGWHDLPTVGRGARASILGGAGLGIPTASAHATAAGSFAVWFASPEVQRAIAVPNGAQPASRAIWDDPTADDIAHGFFRGTRRTMDASFVRPAHPWWPEFQHQAGEALTRLLTDRAPAAAIHAELTRLHGHYNHDNRSRHRADATEEDV